MIKAVILDLDGTLIDSNEAHARSWHEAFHRMNITTDYPEVRKSIGMTDDRLIRKFMGDTERESRVDEVTHLKREIFHNVYLNTIKPFPSAYELIKKMRVYDLQTILASSGDDVRLLLKKNRFGEILSVAPSLESVKNNKTTEDIITQSLKEVGIISCEAIMLGDTPYDIEAASKAGVQSVVLRCGGWSDRELLGAMAIYNDPQDLSLHFDQSPFVISQAYERSVSWLNL